MSSTTPLPTFAESRGEAPFNWRTFLRDALVNPIDDTSWEVARKRAKSWVTCACGNQCAIIPRHESGTPLDGVLATLGGPHGFYRGIEQRDPGYALHCLALIEAHSSFLIRQIVAAQEAAVQGASATERALSGEASS